MSYCRQDDDCDFYITQQANGTFGLWVPKNRFDGWKAVPIGLRFGGAYFCYKTPKALFARIQKLRRMGYKMKPKTFRRVRKQIAKDNHGARALRAMLEPGTDAGLRILVTTAVREWTQNYKKLVDKQAAL